MSQFDNNIFFFMYPPFSLLQSTMTRLRARNVVCYSLQSTDTHTHTQMEMESKIQSKLNLNLGQI